MKWEVGYLPEVKKDFKKIGQSRAVRVMKAIDIVRENPLPQSEGGYGKPLGNKGGANLTNLMKIKLRGEGVRVVYKIERTETKMLVIVVGVRADDEVYELAYARGKRYGLI